MLKFAVSVIIKKIKQNRRNNHEQSKFWSKTKHVSTSGSDYCNIRQRWQPGCHECCMGCVTDFNEISISMGDHKTTDNLAATGAFTVSMATEDTVVGCDYVGIESGRKVPDKFARAGFHATKSEFVNAPLIDELPMALECKVKSFDNGILVGEIVNVCADESVLTDGKIDPKKLKPIAFDPVNNTYLAMGDKVGDAFGSGKALK